MKIIAVIFCLLLGGCYQNLSFGECAREDAMHHTVYDFGGIPECRSGPGSSQQASSHWLD